MAAQSFWSLIPGIEAKASEFKASQGYILKAPFQNANDNDDDDDDNNNGRFILLMWITIMIS